MPAVGLPNYVDQFMLEQLVCEEMNGFLLIVNTSGKIIFVSHTVENLLGHLQVSMNLFIEIIKKTSNLRVWDLYYFITIIAETKLITWLTESYFGKGLYMIRKYLYLHMRWFIAVILQQCNISC